jgi:hypothetical protein
MIKSWEFLEQSWNSRYVSFPSLGDLRKAIEINKFP